MKRFLLFLILYSSLLTLNCYSQQYSWVKLNLDSISGTPAFPDVFFTSDSTGWITTSTTSNIYKTDDGGYTFTAQATSFGSTNAVHMLDANNGYSGGQTGWVYKTTTGGLNWNVLNSIGSNLLAISFPPGTDPNNPVGYACGDNGQVWRIDSTLTNLNTGLAGTFSGISAPSVNNVWVCGGNSIFYYNGAAFIGQSPPSGTFNAIHFINNQEGWVVGNVGVIGHTINGGATWVTQTNPDLQNRSLYDVFFLNSNDGWAVGVIGTILHTTNGGTTWHVEDTGLTTAFLRGVHFTSSTNGYVVGNDKTLLKYTHITSIEDETTQPTEFRLNQNYPNPFNPSTKISWQSPVGSWQTIKVYDVLGNEVATLVDDYKPVGSYEVEFNAEELTSGVYFYQLKTGDLIQTQKMVLTK